MSTESLTSLETWKPIPGTDGIYEASSMGRVRSTGAASSWSRWGSYQGQILTPSPQRNGYLAVNLRVAGKDTRKLIHSLVLQAFIGPRPEGFDACHCNGIKTDNRVENLRWDTRSANQADRKAHGTAMAGIRHPLCKIKTQAEFDALMELAGKTTVSDASRRFGVTRKFVRDSWASK